MADILTLEQYKTFAHAYHERIVSALGERVPRILLAKESPEVGPLNSFGADVISIENSVSLRECGVRLGGTVAIQSNVDNRVVAKGSIQKLRRAVRDCIDAGGSKGHLLSHGLFQDTHFENVQAFVDEAHQSSATKKEDATQGASHP